jgi:hypothetical protein
MPSARKGKAVKGPAKSLAKQKTKAVTKAKPIAGRKRGANPYTLDLDKNPANYQPLSP